MNDVENQNSSVRSRSLVGSYQKRLSNGLKILILHLLLLLIFINISAQKLIADLIIHVPDSDVMLQVLHKAQNESQAFSDNYIHAVETENTKLRNNIDEAFQAEENRTMALIFRNRELVEREAKHEHISRIQYQSITTYLQTWSQLGNDIPYFQNVTQSEQLQLQANLRLNDGDAIKNIETKSAGLKDSIQSRITYDEKYLQSKTTGLIPNLLQTIAISLQVPSFDTDITKDVVVIKEQIRARLQSTRRQLARLYPQLINQLELLTTGFDNIAVRYNSVLDALDKLYSVLDIITLQGQIRIPRITESRIDLSRFIRPDLFAPPTIIFPDVSVVLKPFDDYLLALDGEFDLLVGNITARIQLELDTNLDQALATLAGALTPDDYNPPAIMFGGRSLSPSEALTLDAELTVNLTERINSQVPIFPNGSSVFYPNLGFTSDSFQYIPPPNIHFSIQWIDFPNFFEFLTNWVNFFWSVVVPSLDCVWFVHRAWYRTWDYVEGTACPAPIVNMLSAAEENDEQDHRKKKSGKVVKIISFLLETQFVIILLRGMAIVTVLGSFGSLVYYYHSQVGGQCILSNKGTWFGQNIAGPLLYNQALSSGQVLADQRSSENQFHIQSQCSQLDAIAARAYQRQSFEYEASRVKSLVFTNLLEDIVNSIDLSKLCQAHVQACDGTGSDLCPSLEDGSALPNPCNLRLHSNLVVNQTSLEFIDFNCSSVPSGTLNISNMFEEVQEALTMEENWCMVELFLIGSIWKYFNIIISLVVLNFALSFFIAGLLALRWRDFRSEEYQVTSAFTREGHSIRKEHEDPTVKAEAIAKVGKWPQCRGFFALVGGIAIFTCWLVGIFYTYSIDMVPIWAP